jgi:hypothetical protein
MPARCEFCGQKRSEFLAKKLDEVDDDCPVCRTNFDLERGDPEGIRARGQDAVDGIADILTPGRKLH